jgi:hypothetical protein
MHLYSFSAGFVPAVTNCMLQAVTISVFLTRAVYNIIGVNCAGIMLYFDEITKPNILCVILIKTVREVP